MAKGIQCCINCVPPKRQIGCHATCEEYISEKEQYETEKQHIRDIKEIEYTLSLPKRKAIKQKIKRNRYKRKNYKND